MSAREPAFQSATRGKYNGIAEIWDPADAWHERVRHEIGSAVRRLEKLHPSPFQLVVDVGSGGVPRPLPNAQYLQLDIAEQRLKGLDLAVCADAHALPLRDAQADCILCLGSVANYCSLIELTQELGRICRTAGLLVFHIELSNSLEYVGTDAFRATAALVTTHYQDCPEQTWVYSNCNVRQALANAGFETLETKYFHIASALAYRLGSKPGNAVRWAAMDGVLNRLPFIGTLSDSLIMTCRKKAFQSIRQTFQRL
jgi:SAM-dependent methyltransferase